MSAPLKQRKDFEDEDFQEELTPKFHEFQEYNNRAKFEELMFFARIALFAVSTVLVAFLLLAINLAPILAFLFAGLIGLAITSTVSAFIWSLKR